MFEYFALKGKGVLKQRIKPFKQKGFFTLFFHISGKTFLYGKLLYTFFSTDLIYEYASAAKLKFSTGQYERSFHVLYQESRNFCLDYLNLKWFVQTL